MLSAMSDHFLLGSLVILSLVSVCGGQTHCNGGTTGKAEVEEILQLVNNARSAVALGKQKNGNNGSSLPYAKNMQNLTWNCDLEKEAISLQKKCPEKAPAPAPPGKAFLFLCDYDYHFENMQSTLDSWLKSIENEQLTVNNNNVIFPTRTNSIENYANLIRAGATQIACVLEVCSDSVPGRRAMYCLTNHESVKGGDVVYEKGNKVCDCQPGYNCEPSIGLCEAANDTTTTSTATTTTTSPSEATFPQETGKVCKNQELTDSLRTQFLDVHNVRRSLLAKGGIKDAFGGITLPKATNMYQLVWNCDLENQAIDYLKTCPKSASTNANTQYGENFLRVSTANLPYYRDGVKKAITEWFKVYRKNNTPGRTATYLQSHAAVASYTQVGWATTRHLGCSIAICSSDYVIVCRYLPKGNTIGKQQYDVGNTCSKCPGGTACSPNSGLCA